MPRLRKLCSEPRCDLTQPCPLHPKRGGWTGWNRTNPNANAYRGEWVKLRKRVLAEEPRCRLCGAKATDVDHIIPLSSPHSPRHARSNLRALCERCHRRVTAADFGWGGRRT